MCYSTDFLVCINIAPRNNGCWSVKFPRISQTPSVNFPWNLAHFKNSTVKSRIPPPRITLVPSHDDDELLMVVYVDTGLQCLLTCFNVTVSRTLKSCSAGQHHHPALTQVHSCSLYHQYSTVCRLIYLISVIHSSLCLRSNGRFPCGPGWWWITTGVQDVQSSSQTVNTNKPIEMW